MYYYMNNFFLFSMVGYLYENTLHFLMHHHMTENPFFGPWMPIYGFGVVIILFLTHIIFHFFKMPTWAKMICLFLLSLIVLTVLEEIGGILTEQVFHKSYWDYREFQFNRGKYIALEVSLGWGVASIFFLYLIKPWTDKIVSKIPKFLSLVFLVVFFLDFLFSFSILWYSRVKLVILC